MTQIIHSSTGGGGGGSSGATWGSISGTLSNQTDLELELESLDANKATALHDDGVPTTTPTKSGDIYTDDTTGNTYVSNGTDSSANWIQVPRSSGGAATWGNITGTLSNQTDLNTALSGKQATITSSNKLDYSLIDNTPNSTGYFLVEDTDYTVEYDATKGVAPYNTSYGYTNITITNSDIKEVLGATYQFSINTKPATSTYRNVRVRFGTDGEWYGLGSYTSVSAQYSKFVKTCPCFFVLKNAVNTTTTSKFFSEVYVNTTYSAMTAAEATTGTATSSRVISPKVLNDKIAEMVPDVIDNLTSTSTTDTLSANQGNVLNTAITGITDKIPTQATSSNQLADKAFVNSSINSITAYYITKDASGSQFATHAELTSATTFYSGGEVRVPTRNDYCIVQVDEDHSNATTRYIYQSSQWEYQYTVNETALTSDQIAALNSGITSSLVSTYNGYATTIAGKQDTISDLETIRTQAGQGATAYSMLDGVETLLANI